EAHVHEDQVRLLGMRHLEAGLPVHRDDDVVPLLREPAREHVAVHLVVFDEQDLGHQLSLRRAAVATSARTSPRMVSRLAAPFWRITATAPVSRRRSSAVTSLAVSTTMGTARPSAVRRSSATNWNPSISGIMRSSRIRAGRVPAKTSSPRRPFS